MCLWLPIMDKRSALPLTSPRNRLVIRYANARSIPCKYAYSSFSTVQLHKTAIKTVLPPAQQLALGRQAGPAQ